MLARLLGGTSPLIKLTTGGVILAAAVVGVPGPAGAASGVGHGKIAYSWLVDEYGSNERISVVDATTLERTELPLSAGVISAASPDISPSGRKIAFMATTDNQNSELWVMRTDGTHARKVTGFWDGRYTPEGQPAWMPDGSEIVIPAIDGQDDDRRSELFALPVN